MKVTELEGAMLDYWVAKASGFEHTSAREAAFALDGQTNPRIFTTRAGAIRLAREDSVTAWNPSTDWACGGPIIERAEIQLMRMDSMHGLLRIPEPYWVGHIAYQKPVAGDTPLVAAMRAYVASKFGDEVDAPISKEET